MGEREERYRSPAELAIFEPPTELDGINWELHEAASELEAANRRYQEAILARIALRQAQREQNNGN